jgi:CubicO group peptidase (beta-lactamase class C family)
MVEFAATSRQALHRILLDRQREGRVPGLVGGVARDGRLIWEGAVGVADVDKPDAPLDGDTQFLIASITKTFTAVLVMALRDEGKLALDDTVGDHIPESTQAGITIRQMLSHVSGMQREPVGDVWDSLQHPDRDELVAGWNDAERILRPHHRWHYSNLCYSILGEIVARLDGSSWAESLQARVLDPLELRRTTLRLVAPHATGYFVPPFTDVPVLEPVVDVKATAAAGALASTARDLATWSGFLSRPDTGILSPDTLEEMCQPQIIADLEGWQLAWGLGLMVARVDDQVLVGHTGGMPGHMTGLLVHRESSTAGIVLMNSTSAPPAGRFAAELATYAVQNEPAEQEPWQPGTHVPDELRGLLGRWYAEGQPFAFSVEKGRLQARLEGAPAAQPPAVFTQLKDDLYRTESGRETGELLRVTREADGTVTRLHWATYVFTRDPMAFGEWLD